MGIKNEGAEQSQIIETHRSTYESNCCQRNPALEVNRELWAFIITFMEPHASDDLEDDRMHVDGFASHWVLVKNDETCIE